VPVAHLGFRVVSEAVVAGRGVETHLLARQERRRKDHVAQGKRSRAAFEFGHDHDLYRHVELTVGEPVGDAQAFAAGHAGNLGTTGQIVDRDQITIWHFFILLEMELLKTPTLSATNPGEMDQTTRWRRDFTIPQLAH